jgi:hypothetical protein
MDFWIRPSSGVVAIDDASISGIDCSSIPSNVQTVFWYGAKQSGDPSSGEILYNDRVAVREPFTDPSPYLPLINNWMLAAAGRLFGASPPHQVVKTSLPPQLSPAQAIAIKGGLLDALFAVKRQAPITFQGQTYDGGDKETSAMANAISGAAQQVIDSANSQVNSALSTLAATVQSQSNAALAGTSSNIGTVLSSYGSSLTTNLLQFAANINVLIADPVIVASVFPIPAGEVTWDPVGPSNPTAQTVSITPPTVNVQGPAISWPNSSGAVQNLSFAQMSGLLKALADRRATLQTTHLAMKAAIAAQTSVAGVAGLDITTGW